MLSNTLEILTLPVGALGTNCYLLKDAKTKKAIIVDPGDDGEYIERIISDHGCSISGIFATHGHFDHLLSVTELKLAYHAPFYIHKDDQFLVKKMDYSAKHFLGITPDPTPEIDSYLVDGEKIAIGGSYLDIIHSPGHTPGSICLYSPDNSFVLTGDLIFANGAVGRTDFSYSDPKKLQSSLKKIFRLGDKIKIFPGHGQASCIEKEKNFQESKLTPDHENKNLTR